MFTSAQSLPAIIVKHHFLIDHVIKIFRLKTLELRLFVKKSFMVATMQVTSVPQVIIYIGVKKKIAPKFEWVLLQWSTIFQI